MDNIIRVSNLVELGPSPIKVPGIADQLERFDAIMCVAEKRAFYELSNIKYSIHIPLETAKAEGARSKLIVAYKALQFLSRNNLKTYVHCWDGRTRCATVIALSYAREPMGVSYWLARLIDISEGQVCDGGWWFDLAKEIYYSNYPKHLTSVEKKLSNTLSKRQKNLIPQFEN